MSPIVSVVIPSWNASASLRQTLEAFRALPEACRESIELLVLDEGSTDGTLKVTADFMDVLAHVDSQPDMGVYDAMNRGVSKCRGQWIWFMGAGDIPHADGLQTLLERSKAKSTAVGLACTVEALPPIEPGVPKRFVPRWGKELTWRNTIHHQGLLAPRSWFVETPFDVSLKVLADYAWLLQQRNTGSAIECMPDITLAYAESQGLSRQFNWPLYLEEWKVKSRALHGWRRWLQLLWLPAKWLFKQMSKTLAI